MVAMSSPMPFAALLACLEQHVELVRLVLRRDAVPVEQRGGRLDVRATSVFVIRARVTAASRDHRAQRR